MLRTEGVDVHIMRQLNLPNTPQSDEITNESRVAMKNQKMEDSGTDNKKSSSSSDGLSPRSRQRLKALNQANSVLEVVDGYHHLDGFNLLGVVANPRAGAPGYSPNPTTQNSAHGRYNATGNNETTNEATTTSSYYQTFEQTMSQVSGSFDIFNNVLEGWSRSILEDNPGNSGLFLGSSNGTGTASSIMNPLFAMMGGVTSQEDEDMIPESQIKELPEEFVNVSERYVKTYIAQCGDNAKTFHEMLSHIERTGTELSNISELQDDQSGDDMQDGVTSSLSSSSLNISEIPEIFFKEDFDLTDPATFFDLLLNDKGSGILNNNKNSGGNLDIANDIPVSDLLPIVPLDTLNVYFDRVELALLEQVRANSGQFFAESQRFADLHEDIHNLLDTVQEQRTINSILQKDMVKTAEIIPVCDEQRNQLKKLWDVLDRADSLLQCKSGLAGILAAQDDLTAIQQIKYGRMLLKPTMNGSKESIENGETSSTSIALPNADVELDLLRALKPISVQLDQFEELVINNLRDELVEIFLAWSDHSISSQSSSTVYGNNAGSNAILIGTSHPSILKENIRIRVKEITSALESCQALDRVKVAYQSRLQDVIRMTVRTTVGEFASDSAPTSNTIASGATIMTLPRFLDCLDMLFEQLLALLSAAAGVNSFYISEGMHLIDNDSIDKNETIDDGIESRKNTEVENPIMNESSEVSFSTTPNDTPLSSVIKAAAELSAKSISELLRLRKEAHSLVSLEEMKAIWDICTDFSRNIENLCVTGSPVVANSTSDTVTHFAHTSLLRSTLLAQVKAFVERKHESHMSSLVAALDSERWVQCDVSSERQTALDRLCSGRAILIPSSLNVNSGGDSFLNAAKVGSNKSPEIEAEGVRYKVVWSCLLLVEMILINIAISAQFPGLSANNVGKVSELLRLFNSRTTHLVLGAGAIHSNARLKSINAKHLSLVTQCLGLIMAILPHVRAALASQMPKKQHTLLTGLDQIKKEYSEHNEKILNKFVTIIAGIVEHSLAKQIYGTDFDARAKADGTTSDTPILATVSCCVFLDGVSSNTKKMHQVLNSLLPPDHLKDVFSRIFAYIDGKVPSIFIAAAEESEKQQSVKPSRNDNDSSGGKNVQRVQEQRLKFTFPLSTEGKRHLLLEVETTIRNLNGLDGIHPWDFTARNVFEKRIEYYLEDISASKNEAAKENDDSNSLKEGSQTAKDIDGSDALKEDASQVANDNDDSDALKEDASQVVNDHDDLGAGKEETSQVENGNDDSDTVKEEMRQSNGVNTDALPVSANVSGEQPDGQQLNDENPIQSEIRSQTDEDTIINHQPLQPHEELSLVPEVNIETGDNPDSLASSGTKIDPNEAVVASTKIMDT